MDTSGGKSQINECALGGSVDHDERLRLVLEESAFTGARITPLSSTLRDGRTRSSSSIRLTFDCFISVTASWMRELFSPAIIQGKGGTSAASLSSLLAVPLVG